MTDATGDLNGQSGAHKAGSQTGDSRSKRRAKAETRNFTDGEGLSGVVRPALESVRQGAATARNWPQARGEAAGELVQERPVTAIGAALGVGVIIGMLARR
jgi:ElaB/YqjD/DUF883 family membrane-anchored ribosome-binding protein